MRRTVVPALVGLYLIAIVAANLISAHFGAKASIYNAAALIGLDITTRDRLHDFWGRRRWPKMAALIVTGSALSYAATKVISTAPSHIVARIALASAVAFLASEAADAVVYQALHRRPWLERSNSSNVVSATLDSVLFVSIAFGWNWPIIFGQLCAKVFGGYVWSVVLGHVKVRRSRKESLVTATSAP